MQAPREPQSLPPKPRRHWKAAEPFIDLRLSHWVEIILTAALIFVGVSQLLVYRRQADIMDKQAEISAKLLTETAIERDLNTSSLRPWLDFKVFDVGPGGVAIFKDGFIRVEIKYSLMNVGKLPSLNTNIIFDLVPAGQGDLTNLIQSRQDEACRKISSPQPGDAVFPDNAAEQPVQAFVGVSAEDFFNYRRDQDKSKERYPVEMIMVTGCISYQLRLLSEYSYTAASLLIYKKNNNFFNYNKRNTNNTSDLIDNTTNPSDLITRRLSTLLAR